MKTTVLICLVLLTLTGCKKAAPIELFALIDAADEGPAVGSPVEMTGQRVGTVTGSFPEGSSQRIVVVLDPAALPRRGTLVTGVSAAGLQLAPSPDLDAPKFEPGEIIPRQRIHPATAWRISAERLASEQFPWARRHGLGSEALWWGLAAVVLAAVLLRASIVAFFVSSLIAWLVHPLLLPMARKYVDLARANQMAAKIPSDFAPGGTAAVLESAVTQALSPLPSPQLLSLGAVFLTCYMVVRALQAARN